jgi:hypothetical protein
MTSRLALPVDARGGCALPRGTGEIVDMLPATCDGYWNCFSIKRIFAFQQIVHAALLTVRGAVETPVVRVIAAGLSIGLVTWAATAPAYSACADMWVNKFANVPPPPRCQGETSACTDGSRGRAAVFRAGDQFTLCVKLPFEAYITLWDAAPNGGNVARIYPNFLTHQRNALVLGEKVPGGTARCFGYQDFPLYFPKSKGLGQGKLTLFATPNVDDQPTLKDMKVPGQEMERPRHEAIAQVLNAADDCHKPYSHQILYNVVE